jgi:4-alpha-glucanotransferase
MPSPQLSERRSGVLLHVSSLPNSEPIGTLGDCALQFVDFLQRSKQSWWQTLPVNPIGAANSPYSTVSSCAGEPLFIDLNDLVKRGWLSKRDVSKGSKKKKRDRVNYDEARALKYPVLRVAAKHFFNHASAAELKKFQTFVKTEADWLADFALYSAIAKLHGNKWHLWPIALRKRDATQLANAATILGEEVFQAQFEQYAFQLQWNAVKSYASDRGIGIIGDLPIFVAHDSADVWAHQDSFCLNKDGSPSVVAGVPPDYFNANGQLWGNALYDWKSMHADKYSFWRMRMRRLMELFDVIRLDHFIGFYRYWEIPAKSKTAKNGRWKLTNSEPLFKTWMKEHGDGRLIAEDLGLVTDGVHALRKQFGLPAMKVFQFGFGKNDQKGEHLPHNYVPHTVAYTGTHDNETTAGWFADASRQREKSPFNVKRMHTVLGSDSKTACKQAMIAVASSTANTCIYPMQDVLNLRNEARFNVPGTCEKNWEWRLESNDQMKTSEFLRDVTEATLRATR